MEFIKLKEEYLEMVLKWRVQPDVAKFMATEVEYDMDQQKRWFDKISQDNSCQYWIITYNAVPVGLIGLVDTDWTHRFTIWSYYIGEAKYRKSLGGIAPLYLYNYVFNDLKLNKIFANVMVGNTSVIKLFKFFGFREVGIYKQHYYKKGRYHDIMMLELLADQWKTTQDKFGRFVAVFENSDS
jgi:UDP-4-amino-4,6-dideoxy-N-acetyl-beta-L-altrosamine N-acetyltransferase